MITKLSEAETRGISVSMRFDDLEDVPTLGGIGATGFLPSGHGHNETEFIIVCSNEVALDRVWRKLKSTPIDLTKCKRALLIKDPRQ